MNRQSRTLEKLKLSSTLANSGLLRRTTAYNNLANLAGRCNQCESEKLISNHQKIRKNQSLTMAPILHEHSELGGLPTYPVAPAPRVSPPLRTPDGKYVSPSTPLNQAKLLTLNASETNRENLGCGGFNQSVEWILNGVDDKTNGYIVQKVTMNQSKKQCTGQDNPFPTSVYWEAWKVIEGRPEGFLGWAGLATSFYDTFFSLPSSGQRGIKTTEGHAKFMPNYTEPDTWGSISEAGDLPATKTKPANWSDNGTIHRVVTSQFDCCNTNEKSELNYRQEK
jgi:hypothetical protein